MIKLAGILLVSVLGLPAHAQSTGGKTIEGYWQDTARRILFSRQAHISRAGTGFDLVNPRARMLAVGEQRLQHRLDHGDIHRLLHVRVEARFAAHRAMMRLTVGSDRDDS
jgi:hypothetical protein